MQSSWLPVLQCVATVFCAWNVVDGHGCLPCYNMQTGEYVGPQCKPIPPESAGCEHVYRPCGCCPECAGKIGDMCHHMTPP